jgi:hypothetical protein
MDIWRIGIVQGRAADLAAGGLEAAPIAWVPEGPPFTFLADPFGLWRDERLFVFAEAYDYRTRRGVIDVLEFDRALRLQARRTALSEPWHLSYPFVFEADGETWMAPEAHRSGALTLYRCVEFPDRWEPAGRFELDTPAIDPTVFRHDGLWWLAYSPTGPQSAKQGRLHLAWAKSLVGPWRTHPMNPVRIDRSSSRPGGTPILAGGALGLPVQDCSRTYGGAIRILRIDALTPDEFRAEAGPPLTPPVSALDWKDGLHTFSACDDLTLIDVKRKDRSLGALGIELGRRLGRWRR